ncbi:MAG: LTA synthase family protein [Bdellovibrio sp.]
MLSLVTFISAVDFGFYSFFQDRINVLIFGFFADNTTALIKTIWQNYPVIWIFLAFALFIFLLWTGLTYVFKSKVERIPLRIRKISYPLFTIFFLVLCIINGTGARGSIGLFPLSEMDTGISKSIFINHLCYNGVRAFARAIELKSLQNSHWDSNLQYYGYKNNPRQAFADYFQTPSTQIPEDPLELLKRKTPKNTWAEKTRPHVVLLVMESFGAYWFKYQQKDFDLVGDFKNHLQEDTYLTHFLSGSAATIGSLSSLMIGTPERPRSEFLTESEYLQVPFRSSPALTFKNAGYNTRFIYGGNPGWREINKFALIQNFSSVEGEAEIATKLGGLKESHDWGVYDSDLFEYVFQSLSEATEPQFMLTMTTTNHPPYQLPSTYVSPEFKIPVELQSRLITDSTLANKRFKTYRYSADELANFLTRLKKSPLKDKVIVAVTGDHTFWIVNFTEQELMQKSSVPFYLYLPPAIRKNLNQENFGSHADIFPTLYTLALSEQSYYSLGQDLFANKKGFAINSANLIIDSSGGVLVTAKSSSDTTLDWEGPFEKLISGKPNAHKQELAVKYKSLMSILDYYFMKEKTDRKGIIHREDSRR